MKRPRTLCAAAFYMKIRKMKTPIAIKYKIVIPVTLQSFFNMRL